LRDQWVRCDILPFINPSYNVSHFTHREGQGFILVYSIASRATFERLEVFRQAMLKVKRHKPVFMLVGNKCDKQYEREVSREEGAAMARDFGCRFLETSAKTAQNVEKLFTDLVRMLRSTKEVDRVVPAPAPPVKPPKSRFRCVIL
jgi:GTPase KRas